MAFDSFRDFKHSIVVWRVEDGQMYFMIGDSSVVANSDGAAFGVVIPVFRCMIQLDITFFFRTMKWTHCAKMLWADPFRESL